jgi:hypothetical protein
MLNMSPGLLLLAIAGELSPASVLHFNERLRVRMCLVEVERSPKPVASWYAI